MVKVFGLSILHKGIESTNTLKSAYELQSFGFFQRGSIQEFMGFIARTIVERTQLSTRQSVNEGDYMCHVYVRGDGLAGVIVCDKEYPSRVAHTLITKILDEFATAYPPITWANLTERDINFNQLSVYLTKYQKPSEADAMMKIQQDLDETKIILRNTIEQVLERGEKIDTLVDKSEMLSVQSKAFYKTARKTNSCCSFG